MLSDSAKALFLSAALGAASMTGVAAHATPLTHTASAATVKSQLQSRYAELEAAMESRSPSRIKAMLAPGFSSTLLSGRTVDADGMVAQLSKVPTAPDRSTTTTLAGVSLEGKLAKVEQTMTATAKVKSKSGAMHTMKLIAVSDDTWEQGPAGWQLKSTTSKDMTVTQDGKVVRHAHIGDAKVRQQASRPNSAVAGPQMKGR